MFRRQEKYLLRDNYRRTILIKYKYLQILEKSLLHNKTILKKKRVYLSILNQKHRIRPGRVKNFCLKSGESSAVNKNLKFCRFQINYCSISNKLQNFKINS